MIKAVHIDLDGVVWLEDQPIPGAAEAVAALSRQARVLFLTNTTSRSAQSLLQRIGSFSIPAKPENVLSAGQLAVQYMRAKKPRATVYVIVQGDLEKDMLAAGLRPTRKEERVDFVFVGHDSRTDYKVMNTAMRLIMEGAELVAGHDLRSYPTPSGPALTAGAIAKALEYATGTAATVIGKPEASFFKAALALTQSAPAETLFVSDDLITDIAGAKAVGIRTVLVETGTHKAADCERLGVKPDWVVPSLADVPGLLAEG